jgi:hypothetical protein
MFNRISPRWTAERNQPGEALHLAWMLALTRNAAYRPLIERTVQQFHYERLYVVRFFAAECAMA